MKWSNRHDSLNIKKGIFSSDNYLGMPLIKAEKDLPEIKKVIPFGAKRRKWDGACHFFIEDFRFEMLWNTPAKYLPYFKKFPVVFTPDYSMYSEYPLAVQVWQTFRGRWIGAYLQSHGIKVVPSVGWSDERSYDFCFEGLEKNSTVAISTLGCVKDAEARHFFKKGVLEMNDVLEPETVIIYGSNYFNDLFDNPVHIQSTPDTMFSGEKKEDDS